VWYTHAATYSYANRGHTYWVGDHSAWPVVLVCVLVGCACAGYVYSMYLFITYLGYKLRLVQPPQIAGGVLQ
jgi:hypothetical protein